jgi:hypothetical protein
MKNLKSLLLFLIIPFFGITQSINGVYTGVLSNDSTTIRKDQSFEMALTEYKGKVFGYAYSTFIINDTLYYILKRVKGEINGNSCEVEDDEVISHNFPQKPEKKVFVTYTLNRNATDSVWVLDGNWKTNLTKKYYAISGKVDAKEEKDLTKSKLYQHLGDLNLQNTLAFNKPKENTPTKKATKPNDKKDIAKTTIEPGEKAAQIDNTMTERKTEAYVAKIEANQPEQNIAGKKIETSTRPDVKVPDNKDAIVKNYDVEIKQPETKTASTTIDNQPIPNEKKNVVANNSNPVEKKPEASIVKQETNPAVNKPVVTANNQPNQNEKKNVTATNTNTVASNSTVVNTQAETTTSDKKLVSVPVGNVPTQNEKKDVAVSNPQSTEKKLTSVPVGNSTVQNDKKLVSVPVGSQPTQNEKKDNAVTDKKTEAGFEFQDLTRTRGNRKLKPAATLVDSRVSIPSETIFFKSDSLSIALYDNGEVDGDSVSVIINDIMFIEKQGLKSSAFRKTYYVPADESDSLLVVLYADNLGKYPPNTGLLQIKDGEEIFYVRFKADLNQNAAIVLRRKSKK